MRGWRTRRRPAPEPGPLDTARRLATEGEVDAAIELLTTANAARRSDELERELVDLRLAAAAAMAGEPSPQPWPPEVDDPFPGLVREVPEVTQRDLSPEVVGGAIRHHGCLLVRGMVGADGVARLQQDIAGAFAARNDLETGHVNGGAGGSYRRIEGHDKLDDDRRSAQKLAGALWLAESPRSLFDVVDLYRASGILDGIEGYLGERLLLSVHKSVLRSLVHRQGNPVTVFHQDGFFMGPEVRTVNIWLALTHCGGTTSAPGLEVVPGRVDQLVPKQREQVAGGPKIGLGRTRTEVLDVVGDLGTVTPEFHPGDALLFDQLFVHRTGDSDTHTGPRDAIETWLFAASSFPKQYLPLLV